MFIEEIKAKLKLDRKIMPFTVTLIGDEAIYIEGVKTVLLTTLDSVRLQVAGGVITLNGDSLSVVNIGGGDVAIKGRIKNVGLE